MTPIFVSWLIVATIWNGNAAHQTEFCEAITEMHEISLERAIDVTSDMENVDVCF